MKSAVLSRAGSICISWILFYSFDASTCFIAAHCLLSVCRSPTFFSSLFVALSVCQCVCNFSVSPRLSVCLFMCRLVFLNLFFVVSRPVGRFPDRGCSGWAFLRHQTAKRETGSVTLCGALFPRLWLRVVIQNWCGEERALTSCQRRMFSTGRQASGNDNVGYAWWALTTPFTLWHTRWYLTQCLPLS